MLYLQVLDDPSTGLKLVEQLAKDFPDTPQGNQAEQLTPRVQEMVEAKKIQDKMVVGQPFPDFKEVDLEGNPLSVAQFKGKVVLVDFWATWCGPCIQELPNVLETYQQYHEKGFEIIGISLDNKKESLTQFIENRKMSWPQFFDGNGWDNKLAVQYGIKSIPATYLVDAEGNLAAKNLRGPALAKKVGELLDR